MSIQRSEKVLLVALIVFAIAFFLPAIWIPHVSPRTATGYWCAYVTLVSPWTADGLKDLPTAPIKYFSILLSGWINPLFLISIVLSRREKTVRPSRTLRTVALILMPTCWIVFYTQGVYPFVAYFIWTAAMIVALFSSSSSSVGSLSGDQQDRGAAAGA
jgi:hypothetical protein